MSSNVEAGHLAPRRRIEQFGDHGPHCAASARCYVQPVAGLQIFGVSGHPRDRRGHRPGRRRSPPPRRPAATPLADGDIVVVTSKIVSKAEGRIDRARRRRAVAVRPASGRRKWDKDPAVTEVVLREAKRIVRQLGPVLITETHHGFVCANSGVDQSSSGAHGRLVLLPIDPDASARAHPRRVRRARCRRRRHHLRHVRSGVARGPDRHRHRHRRHAADLQLHRPVRPARPRVQGAGGVPRRRAGRRRRVGQGQHLARAGRRDPRLRTGSADDTATIAPVLRDQSRDLFR